MSQLALTFPAALTSPAMPTPTALMCPRCGIRSARWNLFAVGLSAKMSCAECRKERKSTEEK